MTEPVNKINEPRLPPADRPPFAPKKNAGIIEELGHLIDQLDLAITDAKAVQRRLRNFLEGA